MYALGHQTFEFDVKFQRASDGFWSWFIGCWIILNPKSKNRCDFYFFPQYSTQDCLNTLLIWNWSMFMLHLSQCFTRWACCKTKKKLCMWSRVKHLIDGRNIALALLAHVIVSNQSTHMTDWLEIPIMIFYCNHIFMLTFTLKMNFSTTVAIAGTEDQRSDCIRRAVRSLISLCWRILETCTQLILWV